MSRHKVNKAPEYCNSLCTFWCTEHDAYPYPSPADGNYANFSSFIVKQSIDDDVLKAAEELGKAFARRIDWLISGNIV